MNRLNKYISKHPEYKKANDINDSSFLICGIAMASFAIYLVTTFIMVM